METERLGLHIPPSLHILHIHRLKYRHQSCHWQTAHATAAVFVNEIGKLLTGTHKGMLVASGVLVHSCSPFLRRGGPKRYNSNTLLRWLEPTETRSNKSMVYDPSEPRSMALRLSLRSAQMREVQQLRLKDDQSNHRLHRTYS